MSIVESHALFSVASSSIIKYERFQHAAPNAAHHYLMVAHFAVPEVIEWRATTASANRRYIYCQFYAVVFRFVTCNGNQLLHHRVKKFKARRFLRPKLHLRGCGGMHFGGARLLDYLPCLPLVGKNKPHVRSKILMRCYCESYRQLELFRLQYVLDHESERLCLRSTSNHSCLDLFLKKKIAHQSFEELYFVNKKHTFPNHGDSSVVS